MQATTAGHAGHAPAGPEHHPRPRSAGLVAATGKATINGVLRGDQRRRPIVDPGLAGGLREWLEDGVSEHCSIQRPGSTRVLSLRSLTAVSAGTHRGMAGKSGQRERRPTLATAREALTTALFQLFVTTGGLDDPMADALSALAVDPSRTRMVAFVRSLRATASDALRNAIVGDAAVISRRWTSIPDAWLPRTRDRIAVPLGGGAIVLTGTLDLLIGGMCEGRASTCLVGVTAEAISARHREGLQMAALLETLRSGAPPFRIVGFSASTGEIWTKDLTEEDLFGSAEQAIDRICVLCALEHQ